MRGLRLGLAISFFAMTGCRSVPLATDPLEHNAAPGALALFEIDWWVPLVKAPMLEFLPREPASPAIDPETGWVLILTRDGLVRALSPGDGKVEWSFKTASPFNAGALIDAGIAYVPGGDGKLYALKVRTGELIWKYDAKEELASTPVLADGKVLVTSQADALIAVDQKTGKWTWQYRRDPPSGFTIRGAPAPRVQGGIAYLGFSDGYAVAISVADGTMKWERALSTGGGSQFLDVDATPAVDEQGRVFFASYQDGVFAMSPESGDVAWHTVRRGVTGLLPRGDVLFTAGEGEIGAMTTTTGKALWSLPLANRAGRMPLFAGGLLVVPTNTALIFVDPATGASKSAWNPGKGVSATPAGSNGRIYVLSNLGTVYAMSLRSRGG